MIHIDERKGGTIRLSEISGYPPKVIWVRKENCSTRDIEEILRKKFFDINYFDQDPDRGALVLL